jgi:predicted Rossmann fold flavoprotein
VETSSGKGKTALKGKFREDLLFTHRGLSGPAILQISSYWVPGNPIIVNLLPEVDVAAELIEHKGVLKKQMGNLVSQWLPARLAESLLAAAGIPLDARLADMPDAKLRALGEAINRWAIVPTGSEGYRKAEVTLGGVDTNELSQQTMECRKVPGLYFIGEAVDVTGWLGGYNFQWAWASGVAAGLALA